MPIRGIRGATSASANTRRSILESTRELLDEMVRANEIAIGDIASVYFTVTSDLDAAFPAAAAREMGWLDVALLDAQAPRVLGDVARCIRVLIHWNSDSDRPIRHIYLRGAQKLRPDHARPRGRQEEQ